MTMLIFGAGFSGRAIAADLLARNPSARIYGTTRSAAKAEALASLGLEPLLFDGSMTDALANALQQTRNLVLSISPDRGGDPVLPLLAGNLRAHMPDLETMTYLSTVGVYGDHDGAWVDEDTPCNPKSARSVARLDAEQAWRAAADRAGVPLAILRLSGIYGPGRNQIRSAMDGKARRLIKPGQVFNRIRVEDIGAATNTLISAKADGLFNVTDDEPAPPQDVVAYACALCGVPVPPDQDFDTADLTPMARSFYGENKCVSNTRLKRMGFAFAYPDYRVSLTQLWSSGQWRGDADDNGD